MPVVEMTDRWIKYKKVTEVTDFFDESKRTFGVRVAPSGLKTWFLLYTVRGEHRKRRLRLGRYPGVGLKEARDAADEAIKLIDKGGDPKLTGEVGGITFGELAEDYMARWSRPRKRSAYQDQEVIDRELLPVWKDRPAASIKRREIITFLDAIVDRGAPAWANRVRGVIYGIYKRGMLRDLVPANPVFGTGQPGVAKRKTRQLTDDEIRAFWKGTASLHGSIRDALRMVLLTGQRPGEVAGMRRSEVEGDLWTIPVERHKSKRGHVVPLVGLAAEIVRMGGDPVVFPSNDYRRRDEPINRMTLSYAMARVRKGWADPATPHDLRRTVATNLGRFGVERFIIERVIGHADRSVTGIYDRWSYLPEKRAALEKWDAHVRTLVSRPSPAHESIDSPEP